MKNYTIWVVDDDKIFKVIASKFFSVELPNCKVEFFHDAKFALEKLTSITEKLFPDFILLDIKMPGMSALEFLNACKSFAKPFNSFPKIIMLSSATSTLEINHYTNHSLVYGFWSKPLQKEYFLKQGILD